MNDLIYESKESFSLNLDNPTGGADITLAALVVNIIDESVGSFSVTLSRINGSYGECRVTVSISHKTTNSDDLASTSPIVLTFADGETSKTLSYTVIDDGLLCKRRGGD